MYNLQRVVYKKGNKGLMQKTFCQNCSHYQCQIWRAKIVLLMISKHSHLKILFSLSNNLLNFSLIIGRLTPQFPTEVIAVSTHA